MTANEMEMLAQELATKHGKTVEEARTALRGAMCKLARVVGMPEVKIQAFRSTFRR